MQENHPDTATGSHLLKLMRYFFYYDEHYFNNYYHNYLKRDARVCTHEDVDYYFHKPILPHSVTNLLIHVLVSPGCCNLNRLWRRLKKLSLISNSNVAFTLVVNTFSLGIIVKEYSNT